MVAFEHLRHQDAGTGRNQKRGANQILDAQGRRGKDPGRKAFKNADFKKRGQPTLGFAGRGPFRAS